MKLSWDRIGFIASHQSLSINCNWWQTHCMAPSAIAINDRIIRIFIGCWDSNKVSRIGYIDVEKSNPLKVLGYSNKPVLDIGFPGTFDENGVFPAHVCKYLDSIVLFYTCFQLGHKVRHYNFGGAAVSDDFTNFSRVSQAPILDRADEGLLVRAGQSILVDRPEMVENVYSAGSNFEYVGGKERPCYDIYYQQTDSPFKLDNVGTCILKHDPEVEHGLGRPQIIEISNSKYIFYTRRTLDMNYSLGYARQNSQGSWDRLDHEFTINHTKGDFDSEMVYFPSVISNDDSSIFLFYCGNNFGQSGIGVLRGTLK